MNLRKRGRFLPVAILGIGLMVIALTGCSGVEQKTALEVIKEKGFLTVGTSADYEPYEYVADGRYTGFDIELIKAVGEKIGVDIKIEDMAFDTLTAALQQGKVDAVIACMLPTPERLKLVDFTEPYYTLYNAVVVRDDSDIAIDLPEKMGNYVIGVKTGTTQEEWVTRNLLNTGKIKDDQYFRYLQTDQGISALTTGQIDIFLVDLFPAEAWTAVRPVKIVFRGELTAGESPRIAVAKGNTALLSELNLIIWQLQEEELVEALARKYLAE